MSKLIVTDKYYLLVYETKEAAMTAESAGIAAANVVPSTAVAEAAWWSKRLNCHVWCSEPKDVFLVLEENKKPGNFLLKVLHGNRVGWIFNYSWFDFQEIPHE